MTGVVIRYLGIDLGDKRTGLALADSLTRLPAPWRVLEVPAQADSGRALADAIAGEVRRELGAGALVEAVVGLPRHMDGREGDRAAAARAFAGVLGERLGCVVHFADERLTSRQADWALGGSGLTRKQKRQRQDAVAAAGILSAFLASEAGQADAGEPQ